MDSMPTSTIHNKTGVTIPMNLVCGWVTMLKEKTGNRDIEHALRTIQFLQLTDQERDIVGTVRSLYISEMNGDLTPAPNLRELFELGCDQ